MTVAKIVQTLFKLGLNIAGWSAVVYFFAGVWLTIQSVRGVLFQPTVLAFAALGVILGILLMIAGHFLEAWDKNRQHGLAKRLPMIPLDPKEEVSER